MPCSFGWNVLAWLATRSRLKPPHPSCRRRWSCRDGDTQRAKHSTAIDAANARTVCAYGLGMQTPSSSIESICSHLMYGHCDSHICPIGNTSRCHHSSAEHLQSCWNPDGSYWCRCCTFPSTVLRVECVLLCCQSRTWGATTLPFKGGLSRFGICAKLLNLIKSYVLGVALRFARLLLDQQIHLFFNSQFAIRKQNSRVFCLN